VVLKRTLNTPRLSAKKANWVPLQLFVGWGPNRRAHRTGSWTRIQFHQCTTPLAPILGDFYQMLRHAIRSQGAPQGQRSSWCCFCRSGFGARFGSRPPNWPRCGLG